MTSPETLQQWLQNSQLKIETLRVDGDGRHFNVYMVSPDFAGKNTLERHRMVYAALGDKVGTILHALSVKTLTPDEVR
jgi:acid stress-induced BolA-like protein IbaG/YrbA